MAVLQDCKKDNCKKNSVPFFACAREYHAYHRSYQDIFHSVMSHGRLLQSSEVEKFEKNIKTLVQRKYAVAVGSCTDALFFSLLACGVQAGDEVLVSSFSFIASASCVLRVGAIPVFCDIDPDTYHMSLASAATMVSSKTRAIIVPHLFGKMNSPECWEDFAAQHRIVLIEDAAQSIGATFGDRKAGSMGACSCISFDPTKVIGAPGSGGVFLTDSASYNDRVKKFRYHGKGISKQFECLGLNSQIPTLTAALLTFKLQRSYEWQQKRQSIAAQYQDALQETPILYERVPSHQNHTYHKFVLKLRDADERHVLIERLKEHGIETMTHYPQVLQDHPVFQEGMYREDACIHARDICQRVLSLPIHPWLQESEIQRVIHGVC